MEINHEKIIELYNNGESMTSLAKTFNTYTTTIKRILKKHNVELRHDCKQKGSLYVKDGEKLIEWAKAQDRLVTKAELAKVIGRKRLSPSYFVKYPELGKYVETHEQKDLSEYSHRLYNWLKENNIQYKPNDRTRLKMSVTALLLEDYADMAIQINIRPRHMSKSDFERNMEERLHRANNQGIIIFFLNQEHFENLDDIKGLLNSLKYSKER